MSLRKLRKKILNTTIAQNSIAFVAAGWIRFVQKTTRWEIKGVENLKKVEEQYPAFIVCFWHNRLFCMTTIWQHIRKSGYMLISNHRDGRIIAKTIRWHGVATINGSKALQGKKQKGGEMAFRAMLRALKKDICIGITPDGPRGPAMQASDGIIHLARLAKVPIIPVSLATSRRKVLGTWDKFIICWPFSKGIIYYGKPIEIKPFEKHLIEEKRLELEQELNRISAMADTTFQHPSIMADIS